MSKRAAEPTNSPSALKNRERPGDMAKPPLDPDMGELEDISGSDSEEEILEAGDSDSEGEGDGGAPIDSEDRMDIDTEEKVRESLPQGRQRRENMEYDPSAYDMLHEFRMPWPCLSFDIMRDELGDERRSFPHTVYMVAGTQAARERDNKIIVTKVSQLSKMKAEDSEDEDDDSDDEEEDRLIEDRSLPCSSTTNRLRLSSHTHTAASMAENGSVYIWDLSPHYASLSGTNSSTIPTAANKPASTLTMHGRVEGYALDWSPHPKELLGKIATGDNDGRIFVSTRKEGGNSWATSSQPLRGHTSSIEEIQWSPTERHVLASASSDGTVKIWDTRASTSHQLSVDVSSSDVNVASWCRTVPHLLATGADDGVWGVWDLRTFGNARNGGHVEATASFTHHKEPITSVEFHPTEDSVVAVACADGAITLWDLSVELDDEESRDTGGENVPSQLMFDHRGLEDPKEVHWHRQAPGVLVATGGGGINVFKTFNI